MRTYHIVFKERESDFMSKGENFDIPTDYISPVVGVMAALQKFEGRYPKAQFIALYDLDALADIKGNRRGSIINTVDSEIDKDESDFRSA